jgi:hypothetical protein
MLAMAFSADEMSRDARRIQWSEDCWASDCAMQKPMPLFAPVIRMILDMVRGGFVGSRFVGLGMLVMEIVRRLFEVDVVVWGVGISDVSVLSILLHDFFISSSWM